MLKPWYLFLALFIICPGLLVNGVEGKADYPREIIDDFGRKVIISKRPEKIVSLGPANTEILFAIGAGGNLVGVTTHCDFPVQAKKIDKIGDYTTPNIEAIVDKKPDLIIACYGNKEESIQRLRELGLTVVALHPKSVEEILEDIQLVGDITGYEQEAASLVRTLKKRIEIVKGKSSEIPEGKRPRILYVVWYPELWIAGKGTFVNGLIEMAGGKNIAFDIEGWKIISKEVVIDRDPEIIFCSGMGENSAILREKILEDVDLKKVSATEHNRVYAITSDIVELPTSRIVDGLEKIYYYVNCYTKTTEEESKDEMEKVNLN